MNTISQLLESLAALLGAIGAVLAAIAALIKAREEPEPPQTPPHGKKTPPQPKTRSLWRRPAFLTGIGLIGVAVIFLVVGLFVVNGPPPAPTPVPCSEGLVCEVIEQSDGAQVFSWSQEPGSLTYEYTSACAHSGSLGLHIEYSFTGNGNGGWGVHWVSSKEGLLDVSEYTTLTFWVKGQAGKEKFHVGLKDLSKMEAYLDVWNWGTIDTSGSTVVMPLDQFRLNEGPVKLDSLENISFGFNKEHGKGDICIDDIVFK